MFHSKPTNRGKNKFPQKKKKKKNREKLKTLFILYNNRRFKCYPIPSLQQQTIQKAGMHSFPFFFYSITISNCVKLSTNPSLTIHICLSSIFSQFGWFPRGLRGSNSGNWSCPWIMKFFFGKCSMIVLRYCSLYLSVCLFSICGLRKCVKIKSF